MKRGVRAAEPSLKVRTLAHRVHRVDVPNSGRVESGEPRGAVKDIIVSLFLVSSVVAGASETAGVTNFMEGENPVAAAVRSVTASDAPFAAVAPVGRPSGASVSSMFIAQTDGTGVRARTACAPDAPGAGSIAEGAAVSVVRVGGAECPGWALVASGGEESWVRMTYLNAANPAKQGGSASTASKGGGAAGASKGNAFGSSGFGGGNASGGAGVSGGGDGAGGAGAPGSGNASGGAGISSGVDSPSSIPNLTITKGIGNGQGWGQGIGGGQDRLTSTLPSPGNSNIAGGAATAAQNGGGGPK